MSRGGRKPGGGLTFDAGRLGIVPGSILANVLSPSPKYPVRLNKPFKLESSSDGNNNPSLVWDEFTKIFACHKAAFDATERLYSSKKKCEDESEDCVRSPALVGQLFEPIPISDFTVKLPSYLQPRCLSNGLKRKRSKLGTKEISQRKSIGGVDRNDTDSKLDILEKRESNNSIDVHETSTVAISSDSDSEEKTGGDDEDRPISADEDMDEGTDYANNYFDNGENFLDENETENADDEAAF